MKINLTQQFKEIFEEYSDEVMEVTIEAMNKVAEETADDLKGAGDFENRTGKYRKGWKAETEQDRTFASAVVHNKVYQLTHLLEFSHANRDGGRSNPFPHIEPANREAQEKAIKEITKAIERIK